MSLCSRILRIVDPITVSLSVDERRLLDGISSRGALQAHTGRASVNAPHACGKYGFVFAIAKICRGFLKYSFFLF